MRTAIAIGFLGGVFALGVPSVMAQQNVSPLPARVDAHVLDVGQQTTLAALVTDDHGRAVSPPPPIQARLDGAPISLTQAGQPSAALGAALLMWTNPNPQERTNAANAVQKAIIAGASNPGFATAVVSGLTESSWAQVTWNAPSQDVAKALKQFNDVDPKLVAAPIRGLIDLVGSLGSATGTQATTAGQAPRFERRVLVIVANRPFLGLPSDATAATLFAAARDKGVLINTVSGPLANQAGQLDALVASAGGRNFSVDFTKPESVEEGVLAAAAPAISSTRWTFPTPPDGQHSLDLSVPGTAATGSLQLSVVTPVVQIAGIQNLNANKPLSPGAGIDLPAGTNLGPVIPPGTQADAYQWIVNGRAYERSATQAFVLDPEQLGSGDLAVSVRAIAKGKLSDPYPSQPLSIHVSEPWWQRLSSLLRQWGVVLFLVLLNFALWPFLVLGGQIGTASGAGEDKFAPQLSLAPLREGVVRPTVVRFPVGEKIRLGRRPAARDNDVGHPAFSKLHSEDVVGDEALIEEVPRYCATIWREKTGECWAEFGWSGPGNPLPPQSQNGYPRVIDEMRRAKPLDMGKVQLRHGDVVELGPFVKYVFHTVAGYVDHPTPRKDKQQAVIAAKTWQLTEARPILDDHEAVVWPR